MPKGYLRLLVFNADSALVSQQVQQLSPAALGNYEPLRLQVIAPQDGYVTAFVGNESDADVYFDDVTVVHGQGLQVQEAHHDPFGLELAGLPGTSPGLKTLSQYKFNGKEFQSDLGLGWNHQDWRFFDPQLGRWHVVDPEIENAQESWTPYSFGFDNAVRFADADGRYPGGGDGFGSGFAQGFVGTFTGLRDNVVAAVQSPQAFANAVFNVAQSATPMGMVASNLQLAAGFGQAASQAVQGNPTALGRQLGGVAGQAALALATDGASRALGAARGVAAGTTEGATRQISIATTKSGGHSIVGIEGAEGSTAWFHQTATATKGVKDIQAGPGSFQYIENLPPGATVRSVKVPAANAANAMQKAHNMVGPNNYNSVTNSCVTCAQEVLKAGGVKTGGPTILTPKRLQTHIEKLGK